MDNIDSFILANHKYLTTADMAYELDWTPNAVTQRCYKLKVEPIKRRQQIYNYMRDNPHYNKEKLSEKLGINISEVLRYASEAAIKIYEEKPAAKSSYSPSMIEFLKENLTILKTGELPAKRIGFKDKYNQTGSPLLDRIWNIETTKRETPSAKDARIK